jgi:hypothetical protein
MNKWAMKGRSSVYLPAFRELMVGANQRKDKHELRPGASFVNGLAK